MRLNQLDGLMAFWKVAEHRGFSAAAAELGVSPSSLSQAIRVLEARLGVRLLNRTTRSVSLTEAGHAYLSKIGPALSLVMEAGDEVHAAEGNPSGLLRVNAARIATAMVLQPLIAGFLAKYPSVQLEVTNDEGFVDIVDGGFDAGVRMGESLHRDMIAVPLGPPIIGVVVASPQYLQRMPPIGHPDDLAHHNCIRFRFGATKGIYKWEFIVDGKPTEYEVSGNLTVSDTLFNLEAALEGVGLAYTFEKLALPHVRAKRLKRVLTTFAPSFPGFYLYYPSRTNQPTKMKALIAYAQRWYR